MGACAVFNRDVITQPTCCGHKVTLRAKGHFIKRRQALIAFSSALVCVCVFVGVGVCVNSVLKLNLKALQRRARPRKSSASTSDICLLAVILTSDADLPVSFG